jgi:hypothetical protein
MKASEIDPTSWRFGLSNPKINILMRRWKGISKNAENMENTLLLLMQNPQTTPEQMSMAEKLYANVAQRLADSAKAVDDYLYQGIKPEPKQSVHMMSCAAAISGNEVFCNCKDWQQGETA